jgi:2-oxo-3-hexenedioate decarboxylase
MPALDVQMLVNGEVSLCGSTADILGNPLLALISAARLAATSGWPLKAGDIVLAGAATPAITIAKGMQVLVSIAGLGDVRLSVSP